MTTAVRNTGTILNHWTHAVYRTHAALLYDVEAALFRNERLTREEIRMVHRVAESLGVGIRSRVIDLACGPGRHSMKLAHDGLEVTGVDFSEHFLKIAADAANDRKSFVRAPRFACGDLRALQFADGVFQTALILGNSFGFYSDEQNTRTLREAYRVLKDGAFLCLEITNKERYLAALRSFEQELIDSPRRGRLKSEWWKAWDGSKRRVRTRERHSSASSGKILYEGTYEVRLYDMMEIEDLLRDIGFRVTGSLAFTPSRETLDGGLGETFGSMAEVLFVGAAKY